MIIKFIAKFILYNHSHIGINGGDLMEQTIFEVTQFYHYQNEKQRQEFIQARVDSLIKKYLENEAQAAAVDFCR